MPGLPPAAQGDANQLTIPGFEYPSARGFTPDPIDAVSDYMYRQAARNSRQQSPASVLVQQGELGLYPPFKADPTRQGGVEWLDNRSFYARPGFQAQKRLRERVEARQRSPRSYEGFGIESVSRGDADFVRLRDPLMARERFDGGGTWRPTSNVDLGAAMQQQQRTKSINPGSPGGARALGAPRKQRFDGITGFDIDDVLDAIGGDDPRSDPRFIEMEAAARQVRPPRREEAEGDPTFFEDAGRGGRTWGGIAPNSNIELTFVNARNQLSSRPVVIRPTEGSGQIRNKPLASTYANVETEDPSLAQLVNEAAEQFRTSTITGIARSELEKQRRFRAPSPSEMSVLGPKNENAPNTLAGFMVQAGSRPYRAETLLKDINNNESRIARVSVNSNGELIDLTPGELQQQLDSVVQMALDPNDPSVNVGPSGRFTAESRLPELYVTNKNGDITRLAMAIDTEGSPSLLLREWAPVYDPGITTRADRVNYLSDGTPVTEKQETPLYRIGRPTNQNLEAIRSEIREIMPGVGYGATIAAPSGLRGLLQGMGQRPAVPGRPSRDFRVVKDVKGEMVELSPDQVVGDFTALARSAVDPENQAIGLGGGNKIINLTNSNDAIASYFVQRPDGALQRILLSVRPGPNPEPLVQVIGNDRAFVGPGFLSPNPAVRKTVRERQATDDLYPFLQEMREASFAQDAPVASKQLVVRDWMSGLLREGKSPEQAAEIISQAITTSSNVPSVQQEYGNALRNALTDATGGERRLGAAEPAPAASYVGLAEVLDFARQLNAGGTRQRVIPEGDVRQRIRPRIRLASEDPVALSPFEDERRDLAEFTDQRNSQRGVAQAFADYDGGGEGSNPGFSIVTTRGDTPMPEDLLADRVLELLSQSSLAGQRSLAEYGPIDREIEWRARQIAAAVIRDGGATEYPVVQRRRSDPSIMRSAMRRSQGLGEQELIRRALNLAEPRINSYDS